MKNYIFPDTMIEKIINILADRPYREVFNEIQTIQGQFQQQVQAHAAAAPVESNAAGVIEDGKEAE